MDLYQNSSDIAPEEQIKHIDFPAISCGIMPSTVESGTEQPKFSLGN